MKFFVAAIFLVFALFLQLLLASAGWYFNFTLAVLIALAFTLDFWELVICDLFAVFILNWQPVPSLALIIFALIPIATFASHKIVRSESWIGALTAIFLGFLVFYLAAAPAEFPLHIVGFLEDLVVGFAAGELTLFVVSYTA